MNCATKNIERIRFGNELKQKQLKIMATSI